MRLKCCRWVMCIPGPMACSWIGEREIRINRVRMVEGARPYINTPGQILGKGQEGFYVKTKDTFVEVLDYRFEGKIRVGDRLTEKGI